ncbi:MAG: hypothetical protein K5893_04630 [Prevotella sp.]|nr:hypothetical protein [Prevotella sp.]
MKKILFFIVALFLGLSLASCGDGKSSNPPASADGTEAAAEVDDEAEAAVKAYEEYFVKYEDLMKRSEAGEDIFDPLMELQESVVPISEALIKTEGKRNDDQKARVKAIEEKLDAYKQKIMGN